MNKNEKCSIKIETLKKIYKILSEIIKNFEDENIFNLIIELLYEIQSSIYGE